MMTDNERKRPNKAMKWRTEIQNVLSNGQKKIQISFSNLIFHLSIYKQQMEIGVGVRLEGIGGRIWDSLNSNPNVQRFEEENVEASRDKIMQKRKDGRLKSRGIIQAIHPPSLKHFTHSAFNFKVSVLNGDCCSLFVGRCSSHCDLHPTIFPVLKGDRLAAIDGRGNLFGFNLSWNR